MISTTSWQSGGQTITVTTTQQSGESIADFEYRHGQAVRSELAVHPKDP